MAQGADVAHPFTSSTFPTALRNCLETGDAAWNSSQAALLSLRNSSADCNAAPAVRLDIHMNKACCLLLLPCAST